VDCVPPVVVLVPVPVVPVVPVLVPVVPVLVSLEPVVPGVVVVPPEDVVPDVVPVVFDVLVVVWVLVLVELELEGLRGVLTTVVLVPPGGASTWVSWLQPTSPATPNTTARVSQPDRFVTIVLSLWLRLWVSILTALMPSASLFDSFSRLGMPREIGKGH